MGFDFVRALGVLVVPAPGMDGDAIYLKDHNMLVYNPAMSEDDCREVTGQILARATDAWTLKAS